jgi:hypothetical protein
MSDTTTTVRTIFLLKQWVVPRLSDQDKVAVKNTGRIWDAMIKWPIIKIVLHDYRGGVLTRSEFSRSANDCFDGMVPKNTYKSTTMFDDTWLSTFDTTKPLWTYLYNDRYSPYGGYLYIVE